MKIALVKPPATYADWYRRPVLGLSYISSVLEMRDFECRIFDAYFHSWSKEELLDRVTGYRPDVVGFTAMTHEIVPAAQIASQIKKRLKIVVVVGGCHVTALPQRTLTEFLVFDYGICGEGEKTFPELLECLQHTPQSNLSSIKGIVFRSQQDIVVNEPRPFLTSEELDALPYPAFHQYYGENPYALAGKHSCYVMFVSRGCPYKCVFCMRVLGSKVRRRSAESVVGEMEYAIDRYHAHTFDFADEIFLSNNRETRKTLELMISRGLPKRARWSALTRANTIDRQLIRLAKEAGCYHLAIGVESGDDRILKIIGKGITVKQVREAVRIIKKVGISLDTYYILGHPSETMETLRRTVNLVAKLNTDNVAVGLMVPYPGTRVFDMALQGEGEYRLLTQDWSEYDKYGGKVLELRGLPYRVLARWQKLAVIGLYLRNLRVFDFLKYFWPRRKVLSFLVRRRLGWFLKLPGRSET